MDRRHEEQTLRTVTDAATLLAMQAAIETVTVDPSVSHYCVDLATATRRHQHAMIGASPRGSLALMLTARSFAVISGRDYVTPEDVKAVAHAVLGHRITVRPELWMSAASGATVTADVLSSVPTPSARELGNQTR
jgi:MoxR-like ATPase